MVFVRLTTGLAGRYRERILESYSVPAWPVRSERLRTQESRFLMGITRSGRNPAKRMSGHT